MGKSRKNRGNIFKNIKKTASKTLPVVNNSLKNVGTVAKYTAKASLPIIEKGVSAVYGTMATGLDLGVKGAKLVSRDISKMKRTHSSKRSRKISGGRSKRHRTRRH
jgi:hypothetical protein